MNPAPDILSSRVEDDAIGSVGAANGGVRGGPRAKQMSHWSTASVPIFSRVEKVARKWQETWSSKPLLLWENYLYQRLMSPLL